MQHTGYRYALMAVAAVAAMAGQAHAQDRVKAFNVAAQDATTSIPEFARQAGIQILASEAVVRGRRTAAVRGDLTIAAGLAQLLGGTDLVVSFNDGHTVTLDTASDSPARSAMQKARPVSLVSAVSPAPAPAAPNDGGGVAAAGGGEVGEVVVTARKRAHAESLQTIPVSAGVVAAPQLAAAHVVNLVDVGRMMAGVSMQQGTAPGANNFSIRGMGQSGTAFQDEAPVGLIYDGVYIAFPIAAYGELVDLEEVEVLRGPQGTLFGRNVTGGAVLVNTHKPTFETGAKFTAGLGNYGAQEISVVANAPLNDKLAIRLVGKYRHSDGAYFNLFTNRHLGVTSSSLLRGSVRFEPYKGVTDDLKVEWTRYRDENQPFRSISPTTVPTSPTNLAPLLSQPFLDGYRTPSNYWTVNIDTPAFNLQKTLLASNQLNIDLAGGVVTLISGYRQLYNDSLGDSDGAPRSYFVSAGGNRQRQLTNELRYARDFGWANLTVGVYQFWNHFDAGSSRLTTTVSNPLTNPVTTVTRVASLAQQTAKSIAAFSEVDFRLTPSLTATLGLRYTTEKKKAYSNPFGSCDYALASTAFQYNCASSAPGFYKDDNYSPKASVAYQITRDNLVFASATRGYRSGGYSLFGTRLVSPYRAETVTAYEAGTKNTLLDRRLRLNLALYRNEYRNLQRTVIAADPLFGTISSTFNAANAVIQGVEFEAYANLGGGFDATANYAYTDARYKSFFGITPFRPVQDLKFIRVPDTLVNASLGYTTKVSNWGTLRGQLSAFYSSSFFFNDVNTPGNLQKGFATLDGNMTLTSDKGWSINVWGKNLTNTEYAFFGAVLGAAGQTVHPQPPRTFGFTVSDEF